jgi:hypothetical protein
MWLQDETKGITPFLIYDFKWIRGKEDFNTIITNYFRVPISYGSISLSRFWVIFLHLPNKDIRRWRLSVCCRSVHLSVGYLLHKTILLSFTFHLLKNIIHHASHLGLNNCNFWSILPTHKHWLLVYSFNEVQSSSEYNFTTTWPSASQSILRNSNLSSLTLSI